MKRFAFAVTIAVVMVAGTRPMIGQGGAPPQAAARDVIVVFYDDEPDVDGLAAEHGRLYGASVSQRYHSALKGYAARIPQARLGDIQRDPRVAFVSEDRPVQAVAQTLPTGIDRIDAEGSTHFATNTWNIAVAVIDTGSGPHADLNIAGGRNCSTGKPSNFSDGNGHGTHVAGTIGAINDGAGVVGVAPGIPIYSVRVLNNAGSGSWSSVACGIDWVTANAASLNIKVANMSLGGGGSDDGNCGKDNNDALHKAICGSVAAGVTFVVAAGNDSSNLAGFVPAAYNEVLAVTAVADFDGQPGGGAAATCRSDVDETAADFSNFADSLDAGHTIAAPGVCINSTWKGGGYNTISGTSMASPHVAGLAGLCIGTGNCAGTPSVIIDKLLYDASVQPSAYGFAGDSNSQVGDRYYGYLIYAGGY
jgi:subtilisin family serine protease